MGPDLLTSVAMAWREGEAVRAARDEARRLALEEAERAEWDAHIYDTHPDREAFPGTHTDRRIFEGTGVGLLYGLPDTDHLIRELGDWRLIPGSNRP